MKQAYGVFAGGGVQGIAHIGALEYLETHNIEWKGFAGTSAGFIVAALLAAGYTTKELKEILFDLDFTKFMDKDKLDNLPLGAPLSLLYEYGIFEGDYFYEWIKKLLAKKGVVTFKDLGKPLYAIACDVTRETTIVLPHGFNYYNIKHNTVSVALVARMSMSIPFFFEPVNLTYYKDNQERSSFIVDGGISSNFPMWLFDNDKTCGTIGFTLIDDKVSVPHQNSNENPLFQTFALSVVRTMLNGRDNFHIKNKDFAQVIAIPNCGVRMTDFNLTIADKEDLYQSGHDAAQRKFSGTSHHFNF